MKWEADTLSMSKCCSVGKMVMKQWWWNSNRSSQLACIASDSYLGILSKIQSIENSHQYKVTEISYVSTDVWNTINAADQINTSNNKKKTCAVSLALHSNVLLLIENAFDAKHKLLNRMWQCRTWQIVNIKDQGPHL